MCRGQAWAGRWCLGVIEVCGARRATGECRQVSEGDAWACDACAVVGKHVGCHCVMIKLLDVRQATSSASSHLICNRLPQLQQATESTSSMPQLCHTAGSASLMPHMYRTAGSTSKMPHPRHTAGSASHCHICVRRSAAGSKFTSRIPHLRQAAGCA